MACIGVKNRHFLRISKILTIFGIFFGLTLNAHAIKVDTHVWVGQQIINDLADDGMLSIKIGTQSYPVAVSADVKNAILGNQSAYRMGNIGPDAFPDILSGQTAVHPGVIGGWKTDDWLSWIKSGTLSDDAKAFSYGYLAHAAADTFAHTYVNAYAGDIFNLFDGEIDVETRHIVLESFIAQHTPPLLDINGAAIGSADQVVNVPAEFLRDRLILNDTAADQNLKSNMDHLYLVHKLKTRLQNVIDGPLVDIETLATQLVVKSNTGIILNNQQAQQVFELAQNIHNVFQTELTGPVIDELQRLNNQFVNLNVKLVRNASSAAIKVNNEILAAQANLWTLNGNLIVAINKLARLNAQYTDAQLRLASLPLTVAAQVCSRVCENKWLRCGVLGIIFCWKEVCNTVCRTVQVANDAVRVVREEIAGLNSQIVQATSDRDAVKNAMKAVASAEAALVQSAVDIYTERIRIENDLLNAGIDFYQVISTDINPIRALMQNWINDINSGMREYTVMSGEVIKATMIPNGNPFAPISRWTCQWGIALVGVPSALTVPGCSTVNRVENILASVDKISATLSKINPVSAAVQRLKDRIVGELKSLATDAGYALAEKLTGVDVQQLIGIAQKPGSDASVNAVFGADNSGKFLLKIPDIAARIRGEMLLTQQGYFDPDRYAVMSNAVTLAKLSLLNSQQLNDFVTTAGLGAQTIYGGGTPLYGASPDNILIKAIRSIDGDYQWMGKAPPYPRQAGHLVTANENERLYGYLFDGKRGMRIWNDPQATDRVFRAIFKGPMNPGLSFLLPAEYPYRPCPTNPFPLSVYDQTCVGGALDDDGLADAWELSAIGTLAQGPTDDPDEDGLTNAEEYRLGTNPIVSDTDGDGIPDGTEGGLGYNPLSASEGQLDADGDGLATSQEIIFGSNPMVADTDGDGLSDGREFQFKTNPMASDTDGDGMGDNYEANNGLNPINESDKFADLDSDGLSNFDEFTNGTNPQLADTDSDGLTDGQERLVGTNPLLVVTQPCTRVCRPFSRPNCRIVCTPDGTLDIDHDGLTTLQEFAFGSDPLITDSDGDGLSDGQEFSLGTVPTRIDSDGDSVTDGAEVAAGTDPLNSKSF